MLRKKCSKMSSMEGVFHFRHRGKSYVISVKEYITGRKKIFQLSLHIIIIRIDTGGESETSALQYSVDRR
jgi:hypothetical protein